MQPDLTEIQHGWEVYEPMGEAIGEVVEVTVKGPLEKLVLVDVRP